MTLLEMIQKENAAAFTHGGKFHADDVFSAALLLHFNPKLTIQRGNRVPEEFAGIVFDIGRGEYDHHQKDSRIRENGAPYAAFGLLWEELGTEILSPKMAECFDEKFVQPLDNNDNTGEKNELAGLIGMFNPVWDDNRGSDAAFFEAVTIAGRILEHKWERFRADERMEQQFAELLSAHRERIAAEEKTETMDEKILVLSEFFPCQKQLSATEIAFLVFPSNRGGYCVQPVRKENSSNYKYEFPENWLGLENEALQEVTGLAGASFCHKGGFLLTTETLADAVSACRISLMGSPKAPVVLCVGTDTEDELIHQMPGMENAEIVHKPMPARPELKIEGSYAESVLEKTEWKTLLREYISDLLKEKPEAVCIGGDLFAAYPVMHQLRKKHIPVLTASEQRGSGFWSAFRPVPEKLQIISLNFAR